MVPPGIPLITLFYGLLRLGAVPVMIDPGMGFRAFLKCVETTRAKTLVGIPKAHVARHPLPARLRDDRAEVRHGAIA